MESKLQAENQELRESNKELVLENARLTECYLIASRTTADLLKENHRLTDIILDKQEKGQ